mmetsp:Transcript_5568/g.15769  ORF Transcript_5568/g.15769 Transcript_5568/m.15769 type:complete len:323 (+) Transcript_5568:110-1078(+)
MSDEGNATRPLPASLSALSWENEGTWKGEFQFWVMADAQLGFFKNDEGGGSEWDREEALCSDVVTRLRKACPKFAIMCGDMTQARPGQKFYEPQVAAFKRLFGELNDVPLVLCCGNHDVSDVPTAGDLASYRSRFGPDQFVFYAAGTVGVVVNGSLLCNPEKSPEEASAQLRWLQSEVDVEISRARTEGGAQHVFLFLHQPLFIESYDEKAIVWADFMDEPPSSASAEDWAQFEKVRAAGRNKCVNVPPARRKPILDLLLKWDATAVFAGHFHRNAVTTYGRLQMITTGAVGRPLGQGSVSGFRIVDVAKEDISHRFVPLLG